MSSTSLGLAIVAAGVGIVILGLLIALGAFSWFGRLPGDIRIESESARVCIPFTSMLLISIVVSLTWGILRRLIL